MPCSQDDARTFVDEAVRTGIMFADLVADLLDSLPDDAFPGEEHAEVLLEMLAGSIKPAADDAGTTTVHHATALLIAVRDHALADLQAAAELAAARPDRLC